MNINNKTKLIILFLTFIMIYPLDIFALEYPEINSKITEIYDLTNKEVVYEIDSNKQASIASLTKIVTTITAIESISNLDEKITITQDMLDTVRWDASKAGLKAGDKLTYKDLLYASMLPSGADATNSIAILSSGSIDNFVSKMNKLVTKLGLKNTHFVNVTGLDAEGHYSTADDIRKILEYALKNELFREIYTTKKYTLSNGLTFNSTIKKYNASSGMDTSKILGSKTGFTGEAGYCLSTLSNINSHEFIVIVLNAEYKDNKYYNIVDSINLIDFLTEHFKNQVLVKKEKVVKKLPVRLSKTDIYEIKAKKNVTLYLPDDYDKDKLKIKYTGPDHLSFMNKPGKKIGTIAYYYDNKLITKENVILNSKLEISIGKILKKYFYAFIILFILLILIIRPKKKKKKKVKLRKK